MRKKERLSAEQGSEGLGCHPPVIRSAQGWSSMVATIEKRAEQAKPVGVPF